MEYESIEAEVKAENQRKHERDEAAANREHELKMANLSKDGIDGIHVAFGGVIIMFITIFAASAIGYNMGAHAGEIAAIEARAECKAADAP